MQAELPKLGAHAFAIHAYFAPHMLRWEPQYDRVGYFREVVIECASETGRIVDNHREYRYPENPLTYPSPGSSECEFNGRIRFAKWRNNVSLGLYYLLPSIHVRTESRRDSTRTRWNMISGFFEQIATLKSNFLRTPLTPSRSRNHSDHREPLIAIAQS